MDWECQAYGQGGRTVNALCFFAEPGTRLCGTEDECHTRMAAERTRAFDLIHQKAADGDPTMQDFADVFTDPDQLLGGGQPLPDEPTRDGGT